MPIVRKGGRRGNIDGHLNASTGRYRKRDITDFLSNDILGIFFIVIAHVAVQEWTV